MHTALERLIKERHEWREQRWRRLAKVSERCALGWRNFSMALHREVVLHNSLGKEVLGIRRKDETIEVHRVGHLQALLTFTLDQENGQILYRSPLHEGSVILDHEGQMMAAFLGSLLIVTPEGQMLKFTYSGAAQYLLSPIVGN
ncbi:hypothetical protein Acid345_2633 [Candidatus Koribacter versatilis Ellin345]|uniref:Uncharacterized protein n=1 Tax=Koribacter versatilis (strain Ellin345) TaxID=204669 RepID=Q1INB6_KORVE|nr:hypothetical protein [Candidatus Koribacter versatilis]ABF41634.1 hypothetical protein Acid345_2633 [Candidatus Koribacter versatilis Ellin345]